MLNQHIFSLTDENRKLSVNNLTTLYRILRAIPAKHIEDEATIYFENFFNLLQKVIHRENWVEIVLAILQEDWANYNNDIVKQFLTNIADFALLNVSEEPARPLSDLTYLMENAQETYELFLNNEDLNEWLVGTSEMEVFNLISRLKNDFGFGQVYFSNEISLANLLKQLKNVHNLLKELSIDLEGEEALKDALAGKVLAIGMGNRSRYENGVFYIDFDVDDNVVKVFYDLLYQKVWSLKGDQFFKTFWEHIENKNPQKGEKFKYFNLFAEYVQDCRELLNEIRLQGPEYAFLDDIILSVERMLAQKETLELNKETSIAFFSNWKDEFISKLNEFNVARVLENNLAFRKELFSLACVFEYVVLYDYKNAFWKDINYLEKLVDYSFQTLSDKDLSNYEAFNFFVMQVMDDKRTLSNFVEKSKDLITKDIMYSSFQSYINYFREQKSHYDALKVPSLDEEVKIEHEFWEMHLPDLLNLLKEND